MLNISLNLERAETGGLSEVLLRAYRGRMFDQQCRTRIYVPVAVWSDRQQRCQLSRLTIDSSITLTARTAQRRLDELVDYICNRFAIETEHPRGWLRQTIESFYSPQQGQSITQSVERYCDARDVTNSNRRKMRSLVSLISEFERATSTTLTATPSVEQLESFQSFLLRDHSVNSVACRLRQLRTLVYWHGRPTPNPFDVFQMPIEVYGTPVYLTVEERDRLYQFDELTDSQRVQRDIFIFQCHVGCRVSDLYSLTNANITDRWLIYVPRKTARKSAITIEVPLSDVAFEIISRYDGVDPRGRLLPFISQPRYDEAIHTILLLAGLCRSVMVYDSRRRCQTPRPLYEVAASHTARKTFIQAVYSSTLDKRLVASMTGHSEDSRAFNRYSEITPDMKRAALERTARRQPDMTD